MSYGAPSIRREREGERERERAERLRDNLERRDTT